MIAVTFYRNPKNGDPVAGIKAVREGFALGAFFLGPLWFLNAAAPIIAGLDLGVMALVFGLARGLALSTAVLALAWLFLRLIIAFEARNLLRLGLEWRGWRFDKVIVAASLDEAEARYFSRRLAAGHVAPAAAPGGPPLDLGALAARIKRPTP